MLEKVSHWDYLPKVSDVSVSLPFSTGSQLLPLHLSFLKERCVYSVKMSEAHPCCAGVSMDEGRQKTRQEANDKIEEGLLTSEKAKSGSEQS